MEFFAQELFKVLLNVDVISSEKVRTKFHNNAFSTSCFEAINFWNCVLWKHFVCWPFVLSNGTKVNERNLALTPSGRKTTRWAKGVYAQSHMSFYQRQFFRGNNEVYAKDCKKTVVRQLIRDNMHVRNKIHFEIVQRIRRTSTYPNGRPI